MCKKKTYSWEGKENTVSGARKHNKTNRERNPQKIEQTHSKVHHQTKVGKRIRHVVTTETEPIQQT